MTPTEEELEKKVWVACDKWADMIFSGFWFGKKKSEWESREELSSSIRSFIYRELEIGSFKK